LPENSLGTAVATLRAACETTSMSANQVSLRASAGAPGRVLIERRLRRYSGSTQQRVRAVAERHPRLADLALSFPPLLFALALPRPGEDPEPAIIRAIEGRPLAEVAAAAGVPRWLRRLPVDALTGPLPVLPTGELFGRRIVNYLPRSPKLTTAWLAAVSDAAHLGNEPFAIWIAREILCDVKAVTTNNVRLLGLWAWFSHHPETDGYRLMPTLWRHELGFRAARGAARAWFERVRLELNLGDRRVADLWLRPGPFDGYEFVALDSAARIAEEAAAMENCLRRYGGSVAYSLSRLWSIRRDGRRIANLQIECGRGRRPVYIGELTAARNERAPFEIWLLATRWLHQHDLAAVRPVPPKLQDVDRVQAARWRRLWRPYWVAKRRIPEWLPLMVSWQVINGLR